MYNNYNTRVKEMFGGRVQKISINAGFTCPNRDGSKGVGGCTFCNNQTFHPDYCVSTKSVEQQMKEGIEFFQHYKSQKYLAYFQAYTNTYAPMEDLRRLYEPVLGIESVVGIVIGTRPDCVNDKLLDYFADLSKDYYVMLEYGIESTSDTTLQRINRGHTYEDAVVAIKKTKERGLQVGAHLILGFPGEDKEMILNHADKLSELPLDMLKLHQLQIVQGTKMAEEYKERPDDFTLYTIEEYIDLCIDFLTLLSPHIGMERFISQSPLDMLIVPSWGVKNYEFVTKLEKAMRTRGVSQGIYCKNKAI